MYGLAMNLIVSVSGHPCLVAMYIVVAKYVDRVT